MMRLVALRKEHQKAYSLHHCSPLYKNTARWQLSVNQEEGSYQSLTVLGP